MCFRKKLGSERFISMNTIILKILFDFTEFDAIDIIVQNDINKHIQSDSLIHQTYSTPFFFNDI